MSAFGQWFAGQGTTFFFLSAMPVNQRGMLKLNGNKNPELRPSGPSTELIGNISLDLNIDFDNICLNRCGH